MRKGRKSTKGMVIAEGANSGPGIGAAAQDMVEYTPPMVMDDLRKVKHRISKATYKGQDISRLCKVFTVDIVALYAECMLDPEADMADRIRCAERLENRGWGRAKETVDINTTSITVAAPDIMALINARRTQQAIDIADVSGHGPGEADG